MLGTNRWKQVDFVYNISGWLTAINDIGLIMTGRGT